MERGLYRRRNHLILGHPAATADALRDVLWQRQISHRIKAHHGLEPGRRRLVDTMIVASSDLRMRIQNCILIRSRSIISVICLLVLLASPTGACRVILGIRRLLTPLLHLNLPFLPFLRVHLGFFSQDKVDLKRIGEEDDGRVIEKVGSRGVVVSLELN